MFKLCLSPFLPASLLLLPGQHMRITHHSLHCQEKPRVQLEVLFVQKLTAHRSFFLPVMPCCSHKAHVECATIDLPLEKKRRPCIWQLLSQRKAPGQGVIQGYRDTRCERPICAFYFSLATALHPLRTIRQVSNGVCTASPKL